MNFSRADKGDASSLIDPMQVSSLDGVRQLFRGYWWHLHRRKGSESCLQYSLHRGTCQYALSQIGEYSPERAEENKGY